MKYLVAISCNTLIIGVHLCWMNVWTCFLVEKSQYLARLISLWIFLYIYKCLGSNSLQVTEFWDTYYFRGRKHCEWYFFPQRCSVLTFLPEENLAGNIYCMWTLWDDVLLSGNRCGTWKTCKLVCLLWPSHHSLSWAFPPALPARWSFCHLCFLRQETSSNEVSPVSWKGEMSEPWWRVRTSAELMSRLDCHEQILLTEESRHILLVIWIWKSALNSVIISLEMSCVGLMLHCLFHSVDLIMWSCPLTKNIL